MTLVTLSSVLRPALRDGYAVGGLVVLGWEDARAYVDAAQAEGVPVILQAGPSCRAHTPLAVLGAMFRNLAASVDVPVVAHLDHGYEADECRAALDAGFTSVMFDGSSKPLAQNIEETSAIVQMAHSAGASCEGEIGFVGYAAGKASAPTDPKQASEFARQTGVDAMAVSVGNTHLQTSRVASVDEAAVMAISRLVDVPLVIHGGSGVPVAMRRHLAMHSNVCKFNIGTELRMAFGRALRASLADNPGSFDRVQLLRPVEAPIRQAAQEVLRALSRPGAD